MFRLNFFNDPHIPTPIEKRSNKCKMRLALEILIAIQLQDVVVFRPLWTEIYNPYTVVQPILYTNRFVSSYHYLVSNVRMAVKFHFLFQQHYTLLNPQFTHYCRQSAQQIRFFKQASLIAVPANNSQNAMSSQDLHGHCKRFSELDEISNRLTTKVPIVF